MASTNFTPAAGREIITIRPSTLTSYTDCARRAAASAYPDLFAGFGYELKPRQQSGAAAVGTAVHAAAAYTLKSKVDTGSLGSEGEADDRAITEFRREIENGAIWDDATPRSGDAEKQIVRMVKEYRTRVAPKLNPIAVEQRLEADLGGGFVLSGQADALALLPGAVRDLKTGVERIHIFQLGAYALLARSHGHEVNAVFEDFIARVKVGQAQPVAREITYPVAYAEQSARRRIEIVKRDIAEFLVTGDVQVFPTNGMSQLCSAKFCSAWGTATCRDHKGATFGDPTNHTNEGISS